jgi:hypothetical protein
MQMRMILYIERERERGYVEAEACYVGLWSSNGEGMNRSFFAGHGSFYDLILQVVSCLDRYISLFML